MSTSAGTYHFYSPEACDSQIDSYSGKAADIWALGVVMFCLIFNELPFWNGDINEFSIFDYILKTEVKIPNNIRIIENEKNDENAIS